MKTKQDLLNALKEADLPSSYPTLQVYEKLGVILPPANPIVHANRTDRIYTEEEIKINVQRLRDHLDQRDENKTAQTI